VRREKGGQSTGNEHLRRCYFLIVQYVLHLSPCPGHYSTELTNRFLHFCLLMRGHAKPERCQLRTSRSGVARLSFKSKLVVFARCCVPISSSGKLTFRKEEIALLELNLAGRGKLDHTHTLTELGSFYSEVFLHYPPAIKNRLTLKYP
jgi:hypothetical protein